MPYYPQTGLTQLGEAISGGARDYATRKLALEDEARRRGQQLQDVAAARAYDMSSYANRLTLQGQEETALDLVRKGLLAPGDMNNPDAVAKASAESRSRALDEHYANLLSTPGPDGKPLLSRADLGNPAAISRAETMLDQMMAKANQLKLEQPTNASASLDALTREAQQVRQKLAAVEAKLAEPPPTIDQQVVMNRALQLARDAKGGKAPSQQEIQAMVGQATQEAQQQALQRWFQDKEDAKVQQKLFADSLNSIRAQQSDLTKSFGVAPRASAMVEPVMPVAAPRAALEASPEQRQAALTAAVRTAVGQPPGGPAPMATPGAPMQAAPLPNPISDPIIEAENQRIAQRNLGAQNSALADPYNNALDELNAVNTQIAKVRSGAPLMLSGPDDLPSQQTMAIPRDPSMQAKALSDLLIKQQQVKRDLEAKRRTMLGLPGEAATPVLSNAASSTPADYGRPDDWWRG